MTFLALAMIMMMVLVGGIGVDLMHNEMERTKLQNTLDRAVLAAAHIDQELDPESVVRDYFEKSNQSQFLRSVEVVEDATLRRVTATAHKDVPTQFMRLLGVDTLKAPGRSQAEERFPSIEVSLVLDISRSMNNGDKMSQMRTGGTAFTKAVLRADTADRVSLSIVPFSEHVALPEPMFDALVKDEDKLHDYSYCVELDPGAYDETHMGDPASIMNTTFEQTPHFQWLDSHQNNINSNPNCPNKNHQHIRAFEQDSGELIRGFNGVSGLGSRSIYRGMKWGVALLDPSTRPLVESLVDAGEVDEVFRGRPADYTDPNDPTQKNPTLKVVVLMSSGENLPSMRIAADKYDSPSRLVQWSKNNLLYYLDKHVPESDHHEWYSVDETAEDGNAKLAEICKAAKENDKIIIYSIAFEFTNHDDPAFDTLKNCASSEHHFFESYDEELVDHMFRIGSSITSLRLTN